MSKDGPHSPKLFKGVMISSTFKDLEKHRTSLIKVIKGQGLADVVMENDSAKLEDAIDSSLQMVRDCSAYILVIGQRYGQIPSSKRNPSNVSITELEFEEAQRLKRPTLLFLMGDNHPLTKADFEKDPEKEKKLDAFRERAKQMGPDEKVNRVYATFDSLEDFKDKASQSVSYLARSLERKSPKSSKQSKQKSDSILKTRPFLAEPPYIGSHTFLGRSDQLENISEWASPADTHSVLLFEAIGGAGKSILTWEWMNNHSLNVRNDWAGRFWYSFYEKGAIMADFCRRALAYITGRPLEEFQKMKTAELSDMLLNQLRSRPWLFVLDGLERVLVAYHRYDAAQVADEIAGSSDEIADRNPCDAIRPEDNDLLRALAGASPSKILITSRLIPRVLLNQSNQAIPGVLRVALPGLRPTDAEALFRACGVRGDSQGIQNYLKSHCDCHPLTTGVLAGLINNYLPDRGSFDKWVKDPKYGGQLNFADLDLVQKRNHILRAALDALPEKGSDLLSTLALLSEGVDYETLKALSPYSLSKPFKLPETVTDLEQRGLLQYDAGNQRYDLHPVVRGIAAADLRQEEKERFGQMVVDYFSRQKHDPYEDAHTLDDLRHGLNIIRTFLQMGHFQQAGDFYWAGFGNALLFNLEEYGEGLSLLRPFFPDGWSVLPKVANEDCASYLANSAAICLGVTDQMEEALEACGVALISAMSLANWGNVVSNLLNLATLLEALNQIVKAERMRDLSYEIANLISHKQALFVVRLEKFAALCDQGLWKEAKEIWNLLSPMGREWQRPVYLQGSAEYEHCLFLFWQGKLQEDDLNRTYQLAKLDNNRRVIRLLHLLRGKWQIISSNWRAAVENLQTTIQMANLIPKKDTQAETLLALAKFHLKQLSDMRGEAERLASAKEPSHQELSELWLAIGDHEQAKKHAIKAYKWAWADGKPYVHRYHLDKAHGLLEQLSVPIPVLPSYDPVNDRRFPWEDELAAGIAKLRAAKATKKPNNEKDNQVKTD